MDVKGSFSGNRYFTTSRSRSVNLAKGIYISKYLVGLRLKVSFASSFCSVIFYLFAVRLSLLISFFPSVLSLFFLSFSVLFFFPSDLSFFLSFLFSLCPFHCPISGVFFCNNLTFGNVFSIQELHVLFSPIFCPVFFFILYIMLSSVWIKQFSLVYNHCLFFFLLLLLLLLLFLFCLFIFNFFLAPNRLLSSLTLKWRGGS